MAKWTNDELIVLKQVQTLQNRPLNDDRLTFAEDNPVWEVTVDEHLYIRGAKGITETQWYQNGIKNGGQIGIDGQNYRVKYLPVTNVETIAKVTAAYKNKYSGQYPIDLMVSDQVAVATVELIKEEK